MESAFKLFLIKELISWGYARACAGRTNVQGRHSFIQYLNDKIESKIIKFADDNSLGGKTNTLEERTRIQNYLHKWKLYS